jgi:hypothetical protein
MNYERQKELDRQREIDKTRRAMLATAIATKEAVEENARQTKMARIEQTESLKRQEQIADKNSFRSTVLKSIPLVSEEDIPNYIFQQISSRFSCFRNGYLDIEPDILHQCIDTEGVLEGIISKIRNTIEGKNLVEKIGKQKYLVKTGKVDTNNIEENTNSSTVKMYFYISISIALFIWITFIFLNGPVKNSNQSFKEILTNYVVFNIPAAILFYFGQKHKTISQDNKLYSTIESEIKPLIESIKIDVINQFVECQSIKNLKGSEFGVAKIYFEKYVFQFISKEQSFLPPKCQIGLVDWQNKFITENTINLVKDYIKKLETEISERFDRDWIYSYKIGFFAESKTAAQNVKELLDKATR